MADAGPRPYVQIVEQPMARGFRFRYECEGRSAGSILGEKSTRDNKTHPKIKIMGAAGEPSIVVVSCVTKDNPPKPHPHSLVGKDCQKGVCTVKIRNSDTATFPNIGIQCARKKDVAKALQERRDIRVDPFGSGFNYDFNSIDLSVVRLCFQLFLPDANGKFTRIGKAAVSQCIYDKKSKLDLGICRISKQACRAKGGDEVILLCEKVSKDDIEVVFFEETIDGVIWQARGDFGPQDVHRQYAIVFKVPPYRDLTIRKPVTVQLQLKRPSDNECSEPLDFQYKPEEEDPDGIVAKKRKKAYKDHILENTMPQSAAGGFLNPGSHDGSKVLLREMIMSKSSRLATGSSASNLGAATNTAAFNLPATSLPTALGVNSSGAFTFSMPQNQMSDANLLPQATAANNMSTFGAGVMGNEAMPSFTQMMNDQQNVFSVANADMAFSGTDLNTAGFGNADSFQTLNSESNLLQYLNDVPVNSDELSMFLQDPNNMLSGNNLQFDAVLEADQETLDLITNAVQVKTEPVSEDTSEQSESNKK